MTSINLSKLLEKVDDKYTLVILASKRARQINDYLNRIKRSEVFDVRAPEISSLSKKPLIIALEEIAEDKITYERSAEAIK